MKTSFYTNKIKGFGSSIKSHPLCGKTEADRLRFFLLLGVSKVHFRKRRAIKKTSLAKAEVLSARNPRQGTA
jgi:hypothetical protein